MFPPYLAPRKGLSSASLGVFRVLFGMMMLASALRFLAKGWVHELYVAPAFHFSYWGFAWVKPWPEWGMYFHFALMALAALGVALGLFYRVCIAAFFLLFTYVELLDKTTYLNHYYLVSLVSFLMCFMPLHQRYSLDVRLGRVARAETLPAVHLYALRAQLGLVYVFAGLAKLKSDWLFRGEPLFTWLHVYDHLPLVGELLRHREVAVAMSVAGAVFDLAVVPALLSKRLRPWAYAALLVFHGLTAAMFHIGMFPWVMMVLTLVFFSADWPERVQGILRRYSAKSTASGSAGDCAQEKLVPSNESGRTRLSPAMIFLLIAHFSLQIALPLRQHVYPGDTLWTEQGYRFAWNVMLMEKSGQLEYRVEAGNKRWRIHPREELTPFQLRMLTTQPDMILAYAHHLRECFREDGFNDVRVYADAFVSLNGRPSKRLIDPTVDLASEEDTLLPYTWVLP